jgi:hypothetical protein
MWTPVPWGGRFWLSLGDGVYQLEEIRLQLLQDRTRWYGAPVFRLALVRPPQYFLGVFPLFFISVSSPSDASQCGASPGLMIFFLGCVAPIILMWPITWERHEGGRLSRELLTLLPLERGTWRRVSRRTEMALRYSDVLRRLMSSR